MSGLILVLFIKLLAYYPDRKAAALRHAKYEIMPDDGSYYGEIPGCNGVCANAETLEDCREELRKVLEEWVLFRVHRNLSLPVIDGIELSIQEVA